MESGLHRLCFLLVLAAFLRETRHMDFLLSLDHFLFRKINVEWTSSWFDRIMPVLTDLHQTSWFLYYFVPLILIFGFLFHRLKLYTTVVGLLICFGLSDVVTHNLVKVFYKRSRPEFVFKEVQLKTHSHTGYSFPSNHASNSFAVATFSSFMFPSLSPIFYLLAVVIGFSRVYVGVHFPSDVLAGAFLGWFLAHLIRMIWSRLPILKDSSLLPPPPRHLKRG